MAMTNVKKVDLFILGVGHILFTYNLIPDSYVGTLLNLLHLTLLKLSWVEC